MLCVLRNTLWMLGGQVEISHTDIVLGEWWVGGWMAGCVGGMQWWVLVASKLPDRPGWSVLPLLRHPTHARLPPCRRHLVSGPRQAGWLEVCEGEHSGGGGLQGAGQ
jgi:hypothetical protein